MFLGKSKCIFSKVYIMCSVNSRVKRIRRWSVGRCQWPRRNCALRRQEQKVETNCNEFQLPPQATDAALPKWQQMPPWEGGVAKRGSKFFGCRNDQWTRRE